MAEDNSTEDPDQQTEGPPADRHREGMGERLHHAEHSVEEALKDAVARVENRVILAGGAETSASPEVNFAAAIEVALNPPHPADQADQEMVGTDEDKPATDTAVAPTDEGAAATEVTPPPTEAGPARKPAG